MIKQNFKHFFSLRKLKLPLPRGHDCFLGKKSLSHSPKQLKLLLPRNMIVPWGKANFPKGTMNFLWENAPRNICSEFLCNHISFLLLYMFMTYHWKGFKEKYNFVIENTLIKTHMQKLWSNKFSNTFVLEETWSLIGTT
jgi:hypothetical protein